MIDGACSLHNNFFLSPFFFFFFFFILSFFLSVLLLHSPISFFLSVLLLVEQVTQRAAASALQVTLAGACSQTSHIHKHARGEKRVCWRHGPCRRKIYKGRRSRLYRRGSSARFVEITEGDSHGPALQKRLVGEVLQESQM